MIDKSRPQKLFSRKGWENMALYNLEFLYFLKIYYDGKRFTNPILQHWFISHMLKTTDGIKNNYEQPE